MRWLSDLDLTGSEAQVVVNGRELHYVKQGHLGGQVNTLDEWNRIEGQLVRAGQASGTWRFELSGGFRSGSLRVIAGEVLQLDDQAVVFRRNGHEGERVVFGFASR